MAVLTPKSVIQLTALKSFLDRQRVEFCVLQLCAFFPPAISSVVQGEVFPSLLSNNSHTMHRFIFFMRTNQEQIFDDYIDYKCYVKNLLRFFTNNIASERIDKKFKEFCYIRLLKILII